MREFEKRIHCLPPLPVGYPARFPHRLGAWGDFDDSMLSCGFRRQVRGAGE